MQACQADRAPRDFCLGKAMNLAQLVYFGKMYCPPNRNTQCWIAPGYSTDVDRNGNWRGPGRAAFALTRSKFQ
jgi:hypothetical protein